MKKIYLTAVFLLCAVTILAQTPTFEWAHRFGTNADVIVYDNVVDSDGNIYLTGEFSGTVDFDPGAGDASYQSTEGRDAFVLKLNASGAFVWIKAFTGTGIDFGSRIAVDANQNVVVAGRFQGGINFGGNVGGANSVGDYDGFLLKMDASGTSQWLKVLYGTGADFFVGVDIDSQGNIYATGSFNQSTTLQIGNPSNGFLTSTFATTVGGTYDFLVTKLNSGGQVSWAYSYGNSGNDIGYNLKLSPDQTRLVVCGEFNGQVDFDGRSGKTYSIFSISSGQISAFVQVLDVSNGAAFWAKAIGGQNVNNNAFEADMDANNNVYVTGRFAGVTGYFDFPNTTPALQNSDISGASFDGYVAKYDASGLPLWAKGFEGINSTAGNNNEQGTSVSIDSQGNVYVAGTYNSFGGLDLDPSNNVASVPNYGSTSNTSDIFMVRLNDSGNYSWGTSFTGSNNNDNIWGLSIDDDNNIIASGYFNATQLDLNPISANGDGLVTGNTVGSQDMFVSKFNSNINNTSCLVTIPDANFKAYLLANTAINTNADGEIQCDEASAFTGTINCNSQNISDLTGIESFVNLSNLQVNNNQLTTLDLSSNTALITIRCDFNQLSSLNVDQNTSLTILWCYNNSLTSLDVSSNTALTSLHIYDNQIGTLTLGANASLTDIKAENNNLTSLDVSGLSQLTNLSCNNNALTSLNIANGNNSNFSFFDATTNPNLECVQVDNANFMMSNWNSAIDATASYSEDCSGTACIVTIPDANFKAYLVANTAINTNGDSEIQCDEASAFTGAIICNNQNISDLTGIASFVNITNLLVHNNQLTTLDLSSNLALSSIRCESNQLTDLTLGQNVVLTQLDVFNNQLSTLDLSQITALQILKCYDNQIAALDLSSNTFLSQLQCGYNQMTALNVANGNNTNLIVFDAISGGAGTVGNPNLTCIEVDNAAYSTTNWPNKPSGALFSEDCAALQCTTNIPDVNFKAYLVGNASINTNGDSEIQCDEATAFAGQIDVYNLSISDLTGIEAFVNLTTLYCNNNNLTALDVSANLALAALYCDNNQLTSLDVSANSSMVYLSCRNNNLTALNAANGNNTNFLIFTGSGNANLTCVEVDDANYSTTNWTGGNFSFDATASFSEDCAAVPTCTISSVTVDNISACNEVDDSYTVAITVTYDTSLSGNLVVNGTNFAITGSPQTVQLTGLADGAAKDLNISFSEDASCSYQELSAWTAPVSCATTCTISSATVDSISACNEVDDSYTVAITVTYDTSLTGDLVVNGTNFAITGSPQTVQITDLANGAANDLNIFFSEEEGCSYLELAAWTAPLSCLAPEKVSQTIIFNPINNQFLEDGSVVLEAIASSELAVEYEVISGPATVSGNIVSFNNVGLVTIRASQEGDDTFSPASPVEQSFEIKPTVTATKEMLEGKIQYYPNPVINSLFIDYGVMKVQEIYLIDLRGTIILRKETDFTKLDFSQLKEGIYILKVKAENNYFTVKIVKE